jgi:hypothetical protein
MIHPSPAQSLYAETVRRGEYGYDAPHAPMRRRLDWRFWWGNPIAATTLLTASKPTSSEA